MDIERVNGAKNKLALTDNRERTYLSRIISPQLGLLARLLFAVKRTFSEDLSSEHPLTVVLDTIEVNGLHEAMQHRLTELQTDAADHSFHAEEILVLGQASCTLAEFTGADSQEEAA